MSELKPCPFCGGRAVVYVGSYTDRISGFVPKDRRHYEVFCGNCNARSIPWHETDNLSANEAQQRVIDAWNKRDPGWISVKDELPLPHETVIAITNYGGYFMGWVDSNSVWYNDDCTWDDDVVTHWMPLPQLPEVKG